MKEQLQLKEMKMLSRVSGMTFGPLSSNEIKDIAEIDVINTILYSENGTQPAKHGLLDLRLGTSNRELNCETCHKAWDECPGHFGKIDLAFPCFHIGFFKNIINVLQSICKNCSNILLPVDKKGKYLKKLRNPGLTYVEKKNIRKAIILDCKKSSRCFKCGAYNGVVKKCSTLKIIHIRYQHDKKTRNAEALQYIQTFENVLGKDKDFLALLGKAQEVLNPIRVLELFRKIPRNDLIFCVMDQTVGVPENMILTRILVPPSSIRPSVSSSFRKGTNEDDLTVRMLDIMNTNRELRMIDEHKDSSQFADKWGCLQVQLALLYNGQLTGIPRAIQGNKMGVVQRLKGKQGRFRGNLSGKRVNYSGRTVISPDPNLRIDQVGVPGHIAKILTYKEVVNARNLEYYQQLMLRGRDDFPFVNFFINSKGMRFKVLEKMAEKMSRELKVGDIIYRSLMDGDVVLFNRQPSLHRLSIQAFRVKITKNRTLQFNECCCNPFNADFDGDEMNIHFPQTEEAKAEALVLMESKSNIISPRNGEPLIAAIQDFITGAYLMTQKDRFFTKHQAASMLSSLIDMEVELPEPTILKPVERWTGKQLFSLIMKPNRDCKVLINMKMKCGGKQAQGPALPCSCETQDLMKKVTEKYLSSTECTKCSFELASDPTKVVCQNCRDKYEEARSSVKSCEVLCAGCVEFNQRSMQDVLDPNDNFLVIRNSELLAGYINKGFIGSGSKNSIFYFILRDFGNDHAADALLRLSKLTSWYLAHRGFSISFKDVAATPEILAIKRQLLDKGYAECNEYIRKFKDNELQAAPGCTEEQTLEGILLRTLSQIRDDAGNACDRLLPRNNSPIIMAIAGSKGSLINVCQMIVCVGQQSVNGKRAPNGFDNRSLFLFPKHCYEPLSKGFVENSFYSGLTSFELFFHAIAGREGLVDTAVKTADTGYMQRRLAKTMEDMKCEYDGTVRNSHKQVIQFMYGSDGLDPIHMEAKYKKSKMSKPTDKEGTRPFDFGRILEQICCQYPCKEEPCLTRELVQKIYVRLREDVDYKFFRAEKLASKKLNSTELVQPERARNFGRHMQKFIESLGENLDMSFLRNVKHPDKCLAMKGAICQRSHITRTQLHKFFSTCVAKLLNARVEPGTTVGALAAQSIGEPGTQMTLKTFHFAGVASMNITQGVPRILEIINATKSIKTPFAKCPLDKPYDESFARMVKGRIEKTTLGEIGLHFVTTITESDLSISIKIDLRRIELLKLQIDVFSIRRSILLAKLKLTDQDIKILSRSEIVIAPKFKESPLWTLYNLQLKLPEVIVCGIASVKRVVIQAKKQKSNNGRNEYELIVEGTDKMDLLAIMSTCGVVGERVESNSIIQIKQCLGIEAARISVMTEMANTMASHGIGVDMRHIMLLADTMTRGGEMMGVTRSGLGRTVDSPLMLASFEKTDEHIFDASYLGQTDSLSGVSEKIIMGTITNVGTGSFEVLQHTTEETFHPRMTMFEKFHLPSILIQAAQKIKYERQ